VFCANKLAAHYQLDLLHKRKELKLF